MKRSLLLVLLSHAAALGADVHYFTDNGFGNPSTTLQHPTGEFYKGTTYIAYQGPHEDSYVASYNHKTRKWSGPIHAGVNLMGKSPDPTLAAELDNHGKPAMMVDNNGYIHVVFGAHGGSPILGRNKLGTPGSLRGGKLTHLISKKPEDISEWQVLDNISPFGTYPQFVQMEDGDIYLFYRHGSHRSDWVYQKSTDQGRTFRAPVSILKHKPQLKDATVHDTWYAWFIKGQGDTIAAQYVYHPCATNPNHTNDRFNAYFMQMNATDDSWRNAAGEKLTMSVTKEYADAKTLVADTGADRSSHGTAKVDREGNAHLLFRYGKGQIRYTRWTGKAWTPLSPIVPGTGSQDGDLVVDSPTDIRVLLTSNNNGTGEVGWWRSTDTGASWAKDPPIVSKPGGSYDIGALIENFNDESIVILSEGQAEDYLYKRMMLLSANGLVTRPLAEASQIQEQLQRLRDAGIKPDAGESKAAKRAKKQKKP